MRIINSTPETNWTFVIMGTLLTCFFGLLLAGMIVGFKGVESGYAYNNGGVLCILGTLLI